MKVDLGCGYKKRDGYVRVDSDQNCNPDYLVDFELQPLPFLNDSVDEFIAEHILEHLGDGFFILMQEIYRTAKDGCLVHIKVPHPHHDYFLNDPTHKRPIMLETMKMFSKSYNRYTIEQGWSSSTLGLMYNVDFELIDHKFVYDSFYDEIIKKAPPEYLQRLFREALNTCTEIHMTLMVVKN